MKNPIVIDLSLGGSVESFDSSSIASIPQSFCEQRRPCTTSKSTNTGTSTPPKTPSWKGSGQPPPRNRGIVIGGNDRGKRPVDSSGPSIESNKWKGKGISHVDSLRSDALKEFTEVSHLRKEILLQDQRRMSSGEGSAGAGGSDASFSNSMSRAIGMLDEITPNLDDERYFRAFDLFRDESIRNGFIALPPARKKSWIERL
ncbi:hypothetical protein FH972_005740 [Carpinus fangiana]|uniref:Uncharacterized protein n=1 Tax=Carpinus fangiana TaxID=176857 RepID=A0A5N6QT45_9ROSI|nr:hypothetical protein FH972_005740 [Carpinus fangiana]